MRTHYLIAVLGALCAAACTNPDQPSSSSVGTRPRDRRLGHYSVVRVTTRDLGTLPGDLTSAATAVNDSGVVVGTSSPASGTHAVRWLPNGTVQNLGSLGGSYAGATAINSLGWIVGSATDPSGNSRAFISNGNGLSVVETDSYEANQYWAVGINDAGEIAGREQNFQVGASEGGPLFWAPGTEAKTILDTAAGLLPTGINANGTIVGYDLYEDVPFAYTIATGVTYPPIPQPVSGTASAVNNAGQISATVFVPPPFEANHAMLLYAGSWTDLGTLTPSDSALSSNGNGIDNWGFVVGQSQTLIGSNIETEAYLWGPDFGMYGLGFLRNRFGRAETSSQANATNPDPLAGNGVDSLFVVGQGVNAANYTHAVLWTVVLQWVPTGIIAGATIASH